MFKKIITSIAIMTAAQTVWAHDSFEPLRQFIEQTKKVSGLPSGTAVAIVKDGKIIYQENFGYSNIAENKLVTLLEFALGIELAQIIIVFVVLFLGFLMQTVFRFSKRDWIMVISAIVIGLVIPMILNNDLLA